MSTPKARASDVETAAAGSEGEPGAGPLVLQKGAVLGRYVILDRLGAGGMGVVYSAFDPGLDRRVALKLLRGDPAEDASRDERRLIREAKAMARLAHPNVITVHDVGSHAEGVFLAMELVDGVTLREWMADGPRPWSEVVSRFVSAGRGLAAAHAAGLVHRDFKPENVMIGGDGRVRVLDFGIALPLEGAAVEIPPEALSLSSSGDSIDSPDTPTKGVVGTPAYMAPEQHLRLETDARTDQFSFCVAFYEALYGERPFRGKSRTAMVLAVTGGKVREAPRGSNVPAWLRKVVVRGLAVRPTQRWPSMDALLQEMSFDPGRKRRRLTIGALGLGAVFGAMWIAQAPDGQMCTGARPKAERVWNADRSTLVGSGISSAGGKFGDRTWARASDRIDIYVGAWTAEHRAACEATNVRGEQSAVLLDQRIACLDAQLGELDAQLSVLADADMDVVTRALPALDALPAPKRCADVERLALDSRVGRDEQAKPAMQEIEAGLAEARALRRAGRFSASAERATALATDAEELGVAHLVGAAHYELGLARLDEGELGKARKGLMEAFFSARRADDSRGALVAASRLVYVLARESRQEESMTWSRHAEAELDRRGHLRDEVSLFANNLGKSYQRQGKYEEAVQQHRRALENASGDDDLNRAQILNSLAIVLFRLDQSEEALTSYAEALEIRTRLLGREHPHVASLLNNIGIVYRNRGDLDGALERYEEGLAIRLATVGENHPHVAASLTNIGVVHAMRGDYDAALDAFTRARGVWERRLGEEHPDVATADNSIGKTLALLGRHAQAQRVLEPALARQLEALGAEHPDVAMTRSNLGEALLWQGSHERALVEFGAALETYAETFGDDHPRLAHPLTGRGEALFALGHADAAEPLEAALLILQRPGSDPAELARAKFALARVLRGEDPRKAVLLAEGAREALAGIEKTADVARRLEEVESWLRRAR